MCEVYGNKRGKKHHTFAHLDLNALADAHTLRERENITTVELDSSLLFHRAAAAAPAPPPVFYYSCGRETDHNSWSQQKAAD